MHLLLETDHGAVWYVADGGHFWIRFGNIRWTMDEAALAPYRGYLHQVGAVMATREETEPVYLRTRDPVINLAFNASELEELVQLLDVAEAIHSVERGLAKGA